MKNERALYAGIFFLCLSLLMYEIILTRIFSVILWYHFAFLVISVALFGNGVSGLFLYIFKKYFPLDNLERDLQIVSFCIPFSIICSLLLILKMNLSPELSFKFLSKDFLQLTALFILSSLPFLLGGMCLALALFHRSELVHRIYFFDLFGAGLGCLLTVPILSVMGGPSGILFTAFISSLSPFCFSFFIFRNKENVLLKARKPIAILIILTTLVFSFFNIIKPHVKIIRAKSALIDQMGVLFEKWNSFSMVIVCPERNMRHSWAISPEYKGKIPEQMRIVIDMGAFTEITKFDGNFNNVAYTQYDYSSMAHSLKKDYDCCVIGPGGGKDILSALAYGARRVVGVEVNPIIVKDVMLDKFLDFSGSLYKHPKVEIDIDDGRSFIRKTKDKFDVIQLSMVDTSAATAAGAYVLSENSLYTVDAFLDYFKKLKPGGMLSVGWVNMKVLEGGTRLISLGRTALESIGINNVSKHIAVYMHPNRYNINVMVKPEPFTEDETKMIEQRIKDLGFLPVHIPGTNHTSPPNNIMESIICSNTPEKVYKDYHLDVSPVSDERPFFFYQNRLSDFFKVLLKYETPDFFGAGLFILAKLLFISILLTFLFIDLPLFFHEDKGDAAIKIILVKIKFQRILYFICLGVGFMCIEIPLLQRFILFLGNPTYSLSVVLLGLLSFCGVGSFLSGRIMPGKLKRNLTIILSILILMILLYYVFLTPLLKFCLIYSKWIKVLLTILIIMPIALLLGMAFPTGLSLMDVDTHSFVPWFWAMNSAGSVLGSVLAVFFAINFGIGNTMLIGGGIYLCALIIIITLRKIKISE